MLNYVAGTVSASVSAETDIKWLLTPSWYACACCVSNRRLEVLATHRQLQTGSTGTVALYVLVTQVKEQQTHHTNSHEHKRNRRKTDQVTDL